VKIPQVAARQRVKNRRRRSYQQVIRSLRLPATRPAFSYYIVIKQS
jgi:hypothetical protein